MVFHFVTIYYNDNDNDNNNINDINDNNDNNDNNNNNHNNINNNNYYYNNNNTNKGDKVDFKPGNITFLLGKSVPYVAISKGSIRKLDLWDSLKRLDDWDGDMPGVVLEYPAYINMPSWLSDAKWRIISSLHNDDEKGHGGEQRRHINIRWVL